MEYNWKKGARALLKYDCQEVGDQIRAILAEHGDLDPDILKAVASRKRKSPLGETFNWDKDAAAEAHWRNWSGYILRSIVCKPENAEDEADPIRAFFTVKVAFAETDDEGNEVRTVKLSSVPQKEAMTEEEYREQVLENALRDLRVFRKRYADFKELARVFKEIDKL